MTPILLALMAALGYGAADFFGGLATTRAPTLSVVVLSQCVGVLTVCTVAWALPVAHPHGVDCAWGAAAGLVGGSGLALFYRALGRSLMSVVAPVTALACALVPVLYGLGTGERPGMAPLVGIGLALVAIVLVSMTVTPAAQGTTRRLGGAVPAESIVAAVAAGTCFGAFYVIIRHVAPAAGIWPLAVGRLASVMLYLVACVMARRPLPVRAPRVAWPMIVAAGVVDMTANIFYLFATHRGLLTIVGTLASLYPVTTVALACGVLRERLSRTQAVGLALGVGAVLLISACGATMWPTKRLMVMAPAADAFGCAVTAGTELGYKVVRADSADRRAEFRRTDTKTQGPDMDEYERADVLVIHVIPGSSGAVARSTLQVQAGSVSKRMTRRGPGDQDEYASAHALADADSVMARCATTPEGTAPANSLPQGGSPSR